MTEAPKTADLLGWITIVAMALLGRLGYDSAHPTLGTILGIVVGLVAPSLIYIVVFTLVLFVRGAISRIRGGGA